MKPLADPHLEPRAGATKSMVIGFSMLVVAVIVLMIAALAMISQDNRITSLEVAVDALADAIALIASERVQ